MSTYLDSSCVLYSASLDQSHPPKQMENSSESNVNVGQILDDTATEETRESLLHYIESLK